MPFHLRGVSAQIENRTYALDDAEESTRVRKLNLKLEVELVAPPLVLKPRTGKSGQQISIQLKKYCANPHLAGRDGRSTAGKSRELAGKLNR